MSEPDITDPAAIPGTLEWMDEIVESGCYDCGHEGSADDPCDETCGALPMSWSQMQAGRNE